MKRSIGAVLCIAVAMLFMTGCAGQGPQKPLPDFSPQHIDTNMYRSAYDNVLIIVDGSSSMEEKFQGNEKFDIAREVVSRLNQVLPEMGQNMGLRTFGHSPFVSKKVTVMQYGMEKYTTEGLAGGLAKLSSSGGTSPLFRALEAAALDFEGVAGSKAVIIVSDGKDMPAKTMAAAEALK
ncbi:MAG: VWA domain-containing protein, partial [Desulfamplus sp.]|nr:VWA domain-containing protein [Desulfamplus sp.]